jgi:hypothetical protein
MDDTFSFIAPVMPRRRLDPFALRIGVSAAVFVASIGAFGAFVIRHERSADAERSAHIAVVAQAERTSAEAEVQAQAAAAPLAADADAQATLEATLALAQDAFARGAAFADAGPAQLTDLQPSLLFVDGPSTTPAVVSVAAGDASWSAAVMGASGTCYWLRLSADGGVDRGTGGRCLAASATLARASGW